MRGHCILSHGFESGPTPPRSPRWPTSPSAGLDARAARLHRPGCEARGQRLGDVAARVQRLLGIAQRRRGARAAGAGRFEPGRMDLRHVSLQVPVAGLFLMAPPITLDAAHPLEAARVPTSDHPRLGRRTDSRRATSSPGRSRAARACCWSTTAIACPRTSRPAPRRSPPSCEAADMKFFASCGKGLEYLLADELLALGCTRATATMAGVNVEGELIDAQRAVLWSRLASRVLWPLAEFDCADEHALYAGVAARRLAASTSARGHTLAVDAHVSGEALTHARYAAQRVKDARRRRACAQQTGARPDVDIEAPDLRLNLVVRKGRAIVSIDLGGGPLHRRGWRAAQGEAPLKENLAAAVLMRGDWPAMYRRRRRAARSDVRQRHAADRRRADGGRRRAGPAAPRRSAADALARLRRRPRGKRCVEDAQRARDVGPRRAAPGVLRQRRRSARDPAPRARTPTAAGVGRCARPATDARRRGRSPATDSARAAWSSAIRPTTRAWPPIPRCIARSATRCKRAVPRMARQPAVRRRRTRPRHRPAREQDATSCSTARSNAR